MGKQISFLAKMQSYGSNFICENIVASENLSSRKITPILTCFKMPEAPVGNSSRNREDLNIMNAVEADRIVKEHTGALLDSLDKKVMAFLTRAENLNLLPMFKY